MIEKFKESFREEAAELLNNLEATLLELEEDPSNMDTISSIFRTMHTIKGSSAMFGFDEISHFTHEIESIMDLLREGVFVADRKFIDLTLRSRDLISLMFTDTGAEVHASAEALVAEFKNHSAERIADRTREREAASELPARSAASPGIMLATADPTPVSQLAPAKECFHIRFVPGADVFRNGTKPLLLLDELRSLGDITLEPLTKSIPNLSAIDPESCYVAWDISLTTDKGEDAIRDVFIFVEDSSEILIEREMPGGDSDDLEGVEIKRIGDILVERGITTLDRIESVAGSQKKLGEILVSEKIATPEQVKSALDEQNQLRKLKESRQQDLSTASIRVASEKLDGLVDLVGELVTLQARLNQTSSNLHDAGLSVISEQFERLVSQLRDNTMSIRMLPIGSTFSKFRRLLRDLASDLGKEIDLVTSGAETELDKTVIERLGDPLVHIIRNSVDHGVELPAQREALGKPRKGTVTLSATHSGAHVLIEVTDDGGGLDTDRILAKAIERGIIAEGVVLTEQELFQLIFAPGFSTSQIVTKVSGRGVGMDVVKREIDALGGIVTVASRKGEGTTISLRIPLTLAIIEGLLVRVGNENYVIPLASVDGCIEIQDRRRMGQGDGRHMLDYRNEILPYVGIRELYNVAGEPPTIEQIVVVNANDARIGFVVDQVVGDYQTVIKPLGRMFKSADGLSGATILGDGTVALIVDVNRLGLVAQQEEMLRLKNDGAPVSEAV